MLFHHILSMHAAEVYNRLRSIQEGRLHADNGDNVLTQKGK
jgi:hypothetical protein